MIKAEVISHEGNPAPNWLDRCRTLITPGRTSAVIVVIAAGVLVIALTHHRGDNVANLPVTSISRQGTSLPVKALQVQPLSDRSSTSATDSSSNVQLAGNGTPAPTASSLGAATTPSLNTSDSAAAASTSQNQAGDQSHLNGKSLTNTVQSTVQGVTQTLQHPLGL